MPIDEMLVKIGVDTSQASKVNAFIELLGELAEKANVSTKKLNQSISTTESASNNAMASVEKGADKAKKQVSSLRLAFIGVVGGALYLANRAKNIFLGVIGNVDRLTASQNKLFAISKSEIAQAKQYQVLMRQTSLIISSFATRISLNLVPSIARATAGFNQWLINNKELVANGITIVIKTFSSLIQIIVNGVRFIDKIVTGTIGWKNAIIALTVAWAVLNTAFLFSPVGLVITSIIALLLLIDDLMVYLDGGESLFGDYWLPLINGAKEAWLFIKKLGELIKAIWKGDTDKIKTLSVEVVESIKNAFKSLVTGIKNIFSAILKNILMFFGSSEDEANETAKAVGDAFGLIYDLILFHYRNAYLAISELMDWLGIDAGDVVNAIKKAFSLVFTIMTTPFKAVLTFIKDLFKTWGDDNLSFTEKLGKTFSVVFDLLTAPFRAAIKWIKENFLGFIEKPLNAIKGVGDWIGGKASSVGGWIGDKASSIGGFFGIGGGVDAQAVSSVPAIANNKTISNQSNSTTNVNINQNVVAPDAQTAGKISADNIVGQIEALKANTQSRIMN